jgi:hypothetical protein
VSYFTIINRPTTARYLHYAGMIEPNQPLRADRQPLLDRPTHPGLSALGFGSSCVLDDRNRERERERVRREMVMAWRSDVRDTGEALDLEGRILRHVEREREVITGLVARGAPT